MKGIWALADEASAHMILKKWKPSFFDVFDFLYSNTFIKRYNNSIKTFEHVTFGFYNFRSFGSCILQAVNPAYSNF